MLSIVVGAECCSVIWAGYPACPACHRSVGGNRPHCPGMWRVVGPILRIVSPRNASRVTGVFEADNKGRNWRGFAHCSHCGVRISSGLLTWLGQIDPGLSFASFRACHAARILR